MERKMISIDALAKVLSPKEMKNILGGSIWCAYQCPGTGVLLGKCAGPTVEECESYGAPGIDCEILYCY